MPLGETWLDEAIKCSTISNPVESYLSRHLSESIARYEIIPYLSELKTRVYYKEDMQTVRLWL
jgi:hypothetical protein